MDKVTTEQVRAAARSHRIEMWELRECSICDTPLHYVIDGDAVTYDARCDCSSYIGSPRIASFEDIADLLNMQTPEARGGMWGSFIASGEAHKDQS